VHTLNLRIGKKFSIGERRSVEGAVDVFNVPNAGGDMQLQWGGNQLYSPSYGLGTARQLPRAVQVSARFVF
jgi:hypothetical protein